MAKIRDVDPKAGFRLLVELDNDNVIFVNMADLVKTEKFKDLQNPYLFQDIETDGYSVYWDFGRLKLTLNELYDLTRANNTVHNSSHNTEKGEKAEDVVLISFDDED
jgi:hypothetical protein